MVTPAAVAGETSTLIWRPISSLDERIRALTLISLPAVVRICSGPKL